MPKKPAQNQSDQKVPFREFFNISKWVLKLIYSVNPIHTFLSVLYQFFTNIRGLVNSYVIALMIDRVVEISKVETSTVSDIYPLIGFIFLLNLVFQAIDWLGGYSGAYFRVHLIPHVRRELYLKTSSLGIQTLEDPDINNKIHRARENISNIVNYFYQMIRLFGNLWGVLASLFVIITFAPFIAPIIFLLSIPRFINDRIHRARVWKMRYDNTEKRRLVDNATWDLTRTKSLQEILINNSKIFLDKKFTKFYNMFNETLMSVQKKWLSFTSFISVVEFTGIAAGFITIFTNFIKGLISVGDIYFQLNSLQIFQQRLSALYQLFNNLSEFSLRLKDGYELFNTQPYFLDGDVKIEKLDKGPDIEIKDLKFTYPESEKAVLDNLNLNINSGEKIAVVGPNGAGKTTLMKLICRMYETPNGDILINGKDVDKLESASWYQNVSVLFQDFNTHPYLTPKENIIMGDPNRKVDLKKVEEAAKNSEAHDFIQELPGKYDQILGEQFSKGVRLSTGQWQKLAIARFFYRNTALVIFDEPTASIDAQSEYRIFNKIYKSFKNKTVIIISHRYSTVRNADRIFVLDKGRIIEEGSHKQLLKKNGKYAEAFLLQAEGYKTDEVTSIAS